MSTYAKFSGPSFGGGGGGGGGGITQLTGPVTAGPGSGSQVTTVTSPLVISPIAGSTAIDGNLVLESTTNATKGYVGVVDESAMILGAFAPTSFALFQSLGSPTVAQLYISMDADDPIFNNGLGVFIDTWGGDNAPEINFGATGGTSGAPTYVSNGQVLGGLTFNEWNGYTTADQLSAYIIVNATQDHSSSAFGNEFTFKSTSNGSTSHITTLALNNTSAAFTGYLTGAGFAKNLSVLSPNVGFQAVDAGNHLNFSQNTQPTVQVSANAGTGSSATGLATLCSDVAGQITLVTGSGSWSSGTQVTVSFFNLYNSAPIVTLTPANATAGLRSSLEGVYVTSSTAAFTISFADAASAANTYIWNYQIIETFYP